MIEASQLSGAQLPIIDLDAPQTWPPPVQELLHDGEDLLLTWTDPSSRHTPQQYDDLLDRLYELVRPHSVIGWHSTRLTHEEIELMRQAGMHLPDGGTLSERVRAARIAGYFTRDVEERLLSRHQADEKYRRHRLWFCFYPPRYAGESGIRDLLAHWGGEALYNSHDRDEQLGPILRRTGTPAVVEAEVGIEQLGGTLGPVFKMVDAFLAWRGHSTHDRSRYEDRATSPIPAERIRAIHVLEQPEFIELTGCADWDSELT